MNCASLHMALARLSDRSHTNYIRCCVCLSVCLPCAPVSACIGTRYAGVRAPMFFTLAYAAPELIAAFEAGQESHITEPAVDVWALGVIAFEMLTGESMFEPFAGQDAALSAIAGRTHMPWEGPRRNELLAKLCALQPHVQECLQRDPLKRPTIDKVVEAWEDLFQSSSADSWSLPAYSLPS
jgi:serine/threonine protein kinase